MLTITLDNNIRIPNLSSTWIEGLSKLVSVENEDKETAVKEEVWGAHKLDDLLTLADLSDDGELVLPRGFWKELRGLLDKNEIEFKHQSNMPTLENEIDYPKGPGLRDYQTEALQAMLRGFQGRVIAPPGKGKTVMGLSLVKAVKKPSLILVAQKHIAQQWIDRAEEHIGYTPGLIGDNEWDEKHVTVALIQTLWSRREELNKKDWWSNWNVVILDEQHHIPAETFTHIVSKFPAPYRIGLSATVGKSKAKKRISELIFGPILYEIEDTAMKQDIEVVHTDFEFDFVPTHRNTQNKLVRNNYQKLITALVKDTKRNWLIASRIFDNKDHSNIIFSRRLAHLNTLKEYAIELGFPEDRCWMLTGKESLDERMEIYKKAADGKCAIFSTVADEALDIPNLDRAYLAFPQKNEETIKQQIGRIARENPGKIDAIVYDFVDINVSVLYSQYQNRLRKLYQRLKLKVQITKTS